MHPSSWTRLHRSAFRESGAKPLACSLSGTPVPMTELRDLGQGMLMIRLSGKELTLNGFHEIIC